MSLIFSSNEMWFLVTYLPTFSDNVTLFTVFFLKSSLSQLYSSINFLPQLIATIKTLWHVSIWFGTFTNNPSISGVFLLLSQLLCTINGKKTNKIVLATSEKQASGPQPHILLLPIVFLTIFSTFALISPQYCILVPASAACVNKVSLYLH